MLGEELLKSLLKLSKKIVDFRVWMSMGIGQGRETVGGNNNPQPWGIKGDNEIT